MVATDKTTIKKRVHSNKGKTTWMKGKKHSEKSKRKMSEAHKGKTLSDEHKRNISRHHVGMIGKHHSDETKQKISIANHGKRAWNKGLTKETDERVKKYGDSQKGRQFSDEHKEKLCKARRKRIFPIKDTLIEVLMQKGLRKRGVPFKTHALLLEKYRPDVLIENNLVIECDGDYWHNLPHIIKIDCNRDQELKKAGYQVLRFWGHEIKNDLDGCLDKIMNASGER